MPHSATGKIANHQTGNMPHPPYAQDRQNPVKHIYFVLPSNSHKLNHITAIQFAGFHAQIS